MKSIWNWILWMNRCKKSNKPKMTYKIYKNAIKFYNTRGKLFMVPKFGKNNKQNWKNNKQQIPNYKFKKLCLYLMRQGIFLGWTELLASARNSKVSSKSILRVNTMKSENSFYHMMTKTAMKKKKKRNLIGVKFWRILIQIVAAARMSQLSWSHLFLLWKKKRKI